MSNSVRESEAHNLIKKGVDNKNLSKELSVLRAKYNNADLVDEIQKLYLEKYNKLVRRARKFADLIKKKYGSSQYPFHVLLEKAKKFKQKHNLHDDEFVLFRRFYEEELVGLKSMEVIPYSTNMTKVLGTISVTATPSNMKLSGEDYKHMQEIINMANTNKSLHSQVYLQSLQHKNINSILKFDKNAEYTKNDAVHPVLVALFADKLDKIDSHFLLPSLARIVKNRYNNEPLESKEDANLFYNITRDPNDVVCDGKSSILDLLNRCKIQQQLWNCVLSLREGKMWNRSFNEFMNSIDNCKYNKYDNPDLIYGRNDIVVLRRVLAAFSYRPTIVTSTTNVAQNIFNPYMHTSRPVVMSIPVINIDAENAIKGDASTNAADNIILQTEFKSNTGVANEINHKINSTEDYVIYCVNRQTKSTDHGKLFKSSFQMEYPSSLLESEHKMNVDEVAIDLSGNILKKDGSNAEIDGKKPVLVSSVHHNQICVNPGQSPSKYISKLSLTALHQINEATKTSTINNVYDSEKINSGERALADHSTNKLIKPDNSIVSPNSGYTDANLRETGVIYIFKVL
jgi:hypothetical protein